MQNRFTCFLAIVFFALVQDNALAQKKAAPTDPVYLATDIKPSYPGGNAGIQQYFEKRIDTKKAAQREIVSVSMVVTKTGTVKQAYIGKGISPEIDSAVIKIARGMTAWAPGILKGQKVDARVLFPVIFGPKEITPAPPKPKEITEPVAISNTDLDEVGNQSSGNNNQDQLIYTFVEQMPEFPGGEAALKAFIAGNLKYPEADKKTGVLGQVYIEAVVEKDGSLSNFKILKPLSKTADEEAMRVAKLIPAWQPGKQNGKVVRVKRNLLFRFQPHEK